MRNKVAPHGSKQKQYLLSTDNREHRGTAHRVIESPNVPKTKVIHHRRGDFAIDKGMRSEMWRELMILSSL